MDSVKIAADLYPIEKPVGWLVLLHMMPSTKESWYNFATEAQKAGYESIAIDLRGHGDSITYADSHRLDTDLYGQKINYQNFSDEEHQKSVLDLKAAVEYLMNKRNATPEKIAFIGASIGANLSLQYISENPDFKTAILLSPGLNYRGIKTEPFAVKIKFNQKIFFISAKDDIRSSGNNNAEETQKLHDSTFSNENKKIQIYETGGHGTDILNNQRELTNLIIEFLK